MGHAPTAADRVQGDCPDSLSKLQGSVGVVAFMIDDPTTGAPARRALEPHRSGVPPFLDRLAAMAWRFLVVFLAAAVVIGILVQLRVVVLPIIVAVFLATLLMPLTDRLRRTGLRSGLAAGVTMLAAILMLSAVVGFIVIEVAGEADTLVDDASEAVDEIEDWLVTGPLELERDQVDDARDSIADTLDENSEAITQGAVAVGAIAVEVVTGAALAVVLLFFVLKDGHRAGDALARVIGDERGDDLRELGAKVWTTMGGYLRGVAITGVVDAAIIGLGLALLGVPLVVPLMLLIFLGAFIPLVGATVAGILAAMVALVSNGPGTALAVGALVLVVQQVEGDVLAPLVLGRAVRLHAVSILLALTAGSVLAGIIGAFLAVPIAAVAKTIVDHYHPPRTTRSDDVATRVAEPTPDSE